jgi:hypothetical protein
LGREVFFLQQTTSETTENRDSNLIKWNLLSEESAFSTFREQLRSRAPDGIKKLQGWISHWQTKTILFSGELAVC